MEYPPKNNIPYEQIENGALILLLLRESKTWEGLCRRYADAEPTQFESNTNTFTLLKKLFEMRDLDLISFDDDGKKPIGEIKETGLWSKIRVAFGGMSLREAATISRHSKGMAIAPVFGRPQQPSAEQKIDVFVLMPFKAKLESVYFNHIKKIGEELGVTIRRADEIFLPKPFMEKVWDGICAAQLILADCTEKNPNVFYEIGVAHTVGKRVVLITRSDRDIPSDIKHYDYIPYIYDPEGVEALIGKLRTYIKSQIKSAADALLEFTMIRLFSSNQPEGSKSWEEVGECEFRRIYELGADPVFEILVRNRCSTTLLFHRVGIRLLQRTANRGGTMGESRILKVKAKYSVPCPEEWKEMWGDINDRSEKAIDAVEMEGDSSYVFTLTLENFCDPNSASRSEVRLYLVTEKGPAESRSIWLSQ